MVLECEEHKERMELICIQRQQHMLRTFSFFDEED